MTPLDHDERELMLDAILDAMYPLMAVPVAAIFLYPVTAKLAFTITRNGPIAFVNPAHN